MSKTAAMPDAAMPNTAMPNAVVEICDTGLTAWNGAVATGPAEPGFALVDASSVITGRAAVNQARRHPRRIHHRFWEDLSSESLGHPFPSGLRSTDLAYAQLAALEAPADGCVVEVPGTFSEHQLGLLLGVAKAQGWQVNAFVDLGLVGAAAEAAAGATPTAEKRVLHLDLHLHRLVLTVLDLDDGRLVRRRLETAEGSGLVQLYDLWMKEIGRRFVATTRFDPMHGADSEQALYSALPVCLDHLQADGEADLAIEAGGREHVLELRQADLAQVAQPVWKAALDLVLSSAGETAVEATGDTSALLVLSHRIAGLPGLQEALDAGLEEKDIRWTWATPAALAKARKRALASVENHDDNAVPVLTQMSVNGGA